MSYYLHDHPPARPQSRHRDVDPSGVVVLHCAENATDVRPPDTGAEAVARFIRDRTDAGSYHAVCDSDSTMLLLPPEVEAYQSRDGTNAHAYAISGAFRVGQWLELPQWWIEGCVDRMAAEAADYALWLRRMYGVEIPARFVSAEKARGRTPGFTSHAALDPGRRSDPGPEFPWTLFFDRYLHHLSAQEETMTPELRTALDEMEGRLREHVTSEVKRHAEWTHTEVVGRLDGDEARRWTGVIPMLRGINRMLARGRTDDS